MARTPRRVIEKVLSDATSDVLIYCYAAQGIGRWHHAPLGADVLVVLINKQRQIREVLGRQVGNWDMVVDGITYPSGWYVLGWRMADGSLPHGPLDAVDPAMTDLELLLGANQPLTLSF